MNLESNARDGMNDVQRLEKTGFSSLQINDLNVRNYNNMNVNLQSPAIETIDLEDVNVQINTINYKIDNIKKSNGDVICIKSDNVISIIDSLKNVDVQNMILDKIKGKDIYTGGIKTIDASSILNNNLGVEYNGK